MNDHENRWAALGEIVTAASRADGRSLKDQAAEADVSDKFIKALMAGSARKYGAGAVRVGALWGWPPTWIDDFMAGRWKPTSHDERLIAKRLDGIEEAMDEMTVAMRELLDLVKQGAGTRTPPAPRPARPSRSASTSAQ